MKKSCYLRCLLVVFSFLSVFCLGLLKSVRLVQASANIPNTDMTCDIFYRDDTTNTWHNITNNNGVQGLIPDKWYDCRIRINMNNTINTDEGRNFSLTFNHSTGNIPQFSVAPAQSNFASIPRTSYDYDKLEVINNSARTKTTFNVYNFVSDEYNYLYIYFTFQVLSTSLQSDPTNGIITIGTPTLEITELTAQQQIDSINDNIDENFNELITENSNNTQSIINNQNSNTNSILGGITNIGSSITSAISSLGSTIGGFFTTLGTLISNAFLTLTSNLFSMIADVITAVSDAAQFIIDGVYDLFVPDFDDLKETVDAVFDTFADENPIFGSFYDLINGLFEALGSDERLDHFTIEETEIYLPIGEGYTFVFPETNVNLYGANDSSMYYLIDAVRFLLSGIVTIWVVMLVYRRLFDILGFKRRDNLIDDEGGD